MAEGAALRGCESLVDNPVPNFTVQVVLLLTYGDRFVVKSHTHAVQQLEAAKRCSMPFTVKVITRRCILDKQVPTDLCAQLTAGI
jgi:hypothetical protein